MDTDGGVRTWRSAGARMREMRIRPATDADRPGIDAVDSGAFGTHGEVAVGLVHALRGSGAAVLELVADDGDRVAGHVLVSRGWVDAAARPVTVGILSPLAVAPDRQGRGAGRALVESAARMIDASGVPAMFLEGDPAYYAESGFVRARSVGFASPSSRIPDEAFQVRLLTAHERWMTGRLVYPDAFWVTGAVGPHDRDPS